MSECANVMCAIHIRKHAPITRARSSEATTTTQPAPPTTTQPAPPPPAPAAEAKAFNPKPGDVTLHCTRSRGNRSPCSRRNRKICMLVLRIRSAATSYVRTTYITACIRACVRACIHTYPPARARAHAHANARIHAYTHTHTHTYTRVMMT